MIQRLGERFSVLSHRFMPHPFVFALLLTLLTFVLGILWAGATPSALIASWYDGIWRSSLLVFAMQMALILVTGHALAETRPVHRALERLAGLARGTPSAVAITSLAAMVTALWNWGLGLIVGAFLAREVARNARRRGVLVHYPLVAAAGYTGLLIWHGGLSGSAPVSIATPGHPLQAVMGIVPIRQTLFSPLNLTVTLFLLASVPVLLALMAPPAERQSNEAPETDPEPPSRPRERTLAVSLEESRVLVWVVAAGGLAFLVPYFVRKGWDGVNLNSINFTFLIAGLLLHGTPRRYAESIDHAARGVGGILLQFPFYFGIMGMMQGSGLIQNMAELFVTWAGGLGRLGVPAGSAHAVLTFLSAGVVNLFVPSGGGQWAVQGPIVVEAAQQLGTRIPTAVMGLAYGDELTNMLQPFWALPLLAITGLHARQIVGYTALLMLLVAPGLILLLFLFGA